MTNVWSEVTFKAKGISVSLYEDHVIEGEPPVLLDETWYTYDEIEGRDTPWSVVLEEDQ